MMLPIVCALFLALLLLRAPDILPVRLWAEDGKLFLMDGLQDGFVNIAAPYGGYIHLVPRLTASVAGLLPLEWVAGWFTVVVLAVSGWSASILYRTVGGGIGGLVAASALLLAPGWQEPVGSVTNLQWLMAPALLTVILNPNSLFRCEAVAFTVLAGLSGPFSAAFLPISGVALAVSAYQKKANWPALTAALAGALQAAIIISSPSPGGGETAEPQWLIQRLLGLSLSYSYWPILAVVLITASTLVGRMGLFRLGILVGLATLMLVVEIKFHHQPRIFESGEVGHRYWYIQGALWLIAAGSIISETSLPLKAWGVAAALLLLYEARLEPLARKWEWHADDWSEFAKAARTGPATYTYPPNWSFSLDRRR